MQLISKQNKGIQFLLYVIDSFNKYEWAVPLKDIKSITVTNRFQKTVRRVWSSTKENIGR